MIINFLIDTFYVCLKILIILIAIPTAFCLLIYQYFTNFRHQKQPRINKNHGFYICEDCICDIQNEINIQRCLPPPKKQNKSVRKEVIKTVAKQNTDKYPIITFFQNLSFIYVFNEISGEYEALNERNGADGNQLYISFDEEKPKYFDDAFEVFKTFPSFVVYDLLYIMSIPPKQLKAKSEWNFKITKDDENPVLLEFDNFDGTKKAGTPILLMAMLLKQHIKVITAKTGTKPKQIAYTFTNLGNKKCNRLNPFIQEAFKLVNVNAVPF
uniref:Uncharacterized protein n=1 Tax=Panagrolaimus davidi TaxID=227884 RepID=A0A914P805_9BILA